MGAAALVVSTPQQQPAPQQLRQGMLKDGCSDQGDQPGCGGATWFSAANPEVSPIRAKHQNALKFLLSCFESLQVESSQHAQTCEASRGGPPTPVLHECFAEGGSVQPCCLLALEEEGALHFLIVVLMAPQKPDGLHKGAALSLTVIQAL